MNNRLMRLLVWIGLTNYINGKYTLPISLAPKHVWFGSVKDAWHHARFYGPFYTFRNLPGVIKWREGRLLPRRWGFGIFGLIEIGDRGH